MAAAPGALGSLVRVSSSGAMGSQSAARDGSLAATPITISSGSANPMRDEPRMFLPPPKPPGAAQAPNQVHHKDKGPAAMKQRGRYLHEKPGSDLLWHGNCHTTIGAEHFHFRVRNGIGWFLLAIAARQNRKILSSRRLSRSSM